MSVHHTDDFATQADLHGQFGMGNAHLIWVMSMYLDQPDPIELGVNALTDQPDDKKLDFVYLDRDERRLVFAQGYFTQKVGGAAPANKASDLNTAAAWLVSGDLTKVPKELADIIRECRAAIDQGDIDQIELLYVHNLMQSKNVADELETARRHLERGFEGRNIQVTAKEIGLEECERLFVARESGILVKDEILVPAPVLFEEQGKDWRAAVISLPASWLYEQFHTHSTELFSANYRGFLGVSKRRKINAGIKQTAENAPTDFWMFNNGLTLLTLDYQQTKDGTLISGCSIINGAQTTGSISQIDRSKHDLSQVRVLARVVACGQQETVRNIVRFNNTQNEITTWDQYSNTETQRRLADEFAALGHGYSLKRGFGQSLSGLGIEVVAQPLLAFSGALDDAVRGKNTIFDRKSAYNRAFEGKSARHILFVYALAKAIDDIRSELKSKNAAGQLIKAQQKQLRIARIVRFKYFFMAVVGACLETIVARRVDTEHVAFSQEASDARRKTLEELALAWKPVVMAIFSIFATQIGDEPADVLADGAQVTRLAETISGIVLATNLNQQPAIQEFIALL
ncbi:MULTISPECIES: AIPR family protein [Achromobacter]|uniref:AIPR family protein n=1 Tax=Achromobacter TaxID=222 RepID=UPI00142F0865|nr:AIPR family protein [Achromobacter dolens]